MANGHDDLINHENTILLSRNQYVYHQWIETKPHLNVKLVRNTKSVTWEITVLNAANAKEALLLITDTEQKFIDAYGLPTNGG